MVLLNCSILDADSRYLSAMRIVSEFFASSPNLDLKMPQHSFQIKTSDDWSCFFLRKNQMFLFFQDSVHLVTKWRNRLLSSTADLYFGDFKVSIDHVAKLIDDEEYTKLDHGLTKSDINPKDRQNYKSCIRLISYDVLNILLKDDEAYGTVIYLKLLKMIVRSYIHIEEPIGERKRVQTFSKSIDCNHSLYYSLKVFNQHGLSYSYVVFGYRI